VWKEAEAERNSNGEGGVDEYFDQVSWVKGDGIEVG
jgi:hypothetical protein